MGKARPFGKRSNKISTHSLFSRGSKTEYLTPRKWVTWDFSVELIMGSFFLDMSRSIPSSSLAEFKFQIASPANKMSNVHDRSMDVNVAHTLMDGYRMSR